MEQKKSKADLMMEKLEEAFIQNGLKLPTKVEKQGCFITVIRKGEMKSDE